MFEKIIIIKVFVILSLQCQTNNQYEYLSKSLTDDGQMGTLCCTQKYNLGDTIKISFQATKKIEIADGQATTNSEK